MACWVRKRLLKNAIQLRTANYFQLFSFLFFSNLFRYQDLSCALLKVFIHILFMSGCIWILWVMLQINEQERFSTKILYIMIKKYIHNVIFHQLRCEMCLTITHNNWLRDIVCSIWCTFPHRQCWWVFKNSIHVHTRFQNWANRRKTGKHKGSHDILVSPHIYYEIPLQRQSGFHKCEFRTVDSGHLKLPHMYVFIISY